MRDHEDATRDCMVAFITCSTVKEAEHITDALLEGRYAACVNITKPVTSYYWWQGRREKSSEIMLIVKTRQQVFDQLINCVETLHSYETPEIIAFPIIAGNEKYLSWLCVECG